MTLILGRSDVTTLVGAHVRTHRRYERRVSVLMTDVWPVPSLTISMATLGNTLQWVAVSWRKGDLRAAFSIIPNPSP